MAHNPSHRKPRDEIVDDILQKAIGDTNAIQRKLVLDAVSAMFSDTPLDKDSDRGSMLVYHVAAFLSNPLLFIGALGALWPAGRLAAYGESIGLGELVLATLSDPMSLIERLMYYLPAQIALILAGALFIIEIWSMGSSFSLRRVESRCHSGRGGGQNWVLPYLEPLRRAMLVNSWLYPTSRALITSGLAVLTALISTRATSIPGWIVAAAIWAGFVGGRLLCTHICMERVLGGSIRELHKSLDVAFPPSGLES